jgi:hypothetical protein
MLLPDLAVCLFVYSVYTVYSTAPKMGSCHSYIAFSTLRIPQIRQVASGGNADFGPLEAGYDSSSFITTQAEQFGATCVANFACYQRQPSWVRLHIFNACLTASCSALQPDLPETCLFMLPNMSSPCRSAASNRIIHVVPSLAHI